MNFAKRKGENPTERRRKAIPILAPFPQAVSKKGSVTFPWEIKSVSVIDPIPQTDNCNRKMIIPMGDNPSDLSVRNHEMFHVKWSPDSYSWPENTAISPNTIAATEEVRVNLLGKESGITLSSGTHGEAQIAAIVNSILSKSKNPLYDAGCVGYSLFGRGRDLAVFVKHLQYADKYVGKIMKKFIHSTVKEFNLWSEAERNSPGDGYLRNYRHFWSYFGSKLERLKTVSADDPVAQHTETQLSLEEMMSNCFPDRRFAEGDGWGVMTIENPPLTRSIKPKLSSNTRKLPKDEGVVPIKMHNYCSSMKVFSTVFRQKAGGAVLIDCSGSMGNQTEAIKKLMEYSPSAWVGMYGGNDRDHGVLRIVCNKARMAQERYIANRPGDGGNSVDGPALEILAKQKGPRYWISDGQVTGLMGFSAWVLNDAMRICKKGKITRIESINQFLNLLESGELKV